MSGKVPSPGIEALISELGTFSAPNAMSHPVPLIGV